MIDQKRILVTGGAGFIGSHLCGDLIIEGKDLLCAGNLNTGRKHPNDGGMVSNFIIQAPQGKPITIYGDDSQTRSFCYMGDLIEAITRLMATAQNVTGPMNISIV
ncbi:NAD-dependent epimerase/dehydratase family protein [uncultured Desulfosarcina sp.]|uniref:NAD-dependent epimerase/dehydratase family protein n=1 Tax=uncultured Desulfosarcina sp. TaxID=218289 RepID=UPI0029C858D8|nr:NAD-dependent epimerase/dehydratase family protein [uncultured Desulfosarcina sp.]